MTIKKKSESFENKQFVYNIGILIMLVTGAIVGYLIKTIGAPPAIPVMCLVLPFFLWMMVPAIIAEFVEWIWGLKPDGWLAAVQAVWDY